MLTTERRPSPSAFDTKSASMGKRMNIMWMLLAGR